MAYSETSSAAELYQPLVNGDSSERPNKGPLNLNADVESSPDGRMSGDSKPKISLTFTDLTYEVVLPKTKEVKKILQGVSGHVSSGQMLAILGPSGAGKTTMLDILAQRQKGGKVSGELLMNGRPIDPGVFRRVSCYVQQEDILHSYLSVEETIEYAARLRTEEGVTRAEIKKKVETVMQQLGIEHVRGTKIGSDFVRGISGGEKKRCAIAVELVTSPSLIYLDELTTGLDTFTALHLIYLLKKLAGAGATIVFSIHQPRSSIFRLFDSVLVLNGLGEQAYFGPAQYALDFLVSVGVRSTHPDNPADFLLDSVAVVRSGEALSHEDFPFLPPPTQATDIAAAFRATKLDQVHRQIDTITRGYEADSLLPSAMSSPYYRGLGIQVLVVSTRAFVNKIRDPIATAVGITVAIFFGLLVGSIYWQLNHVGKAAITNRLGVLFFLTMNTAFSSLGSLAMFLFDRAIYVREHKNGMYRPSAYFLGKIVQDLPLSIFITFIFNVITYFMTGLRKSAVHFGWFVLIMQLVMLNSYSMCMFVSNISKNYQVANLIAPVFMVLYLLPSGFMINLNSLPVYWRWMKYISFFRFGFESLVVNEFNGEMFDLTAPVTRYHYNATTHTNTSHTVYVPYHAPGMALIEDQLGFTPDNFKLNVLWCGVSACVYFILGYLALRFMRSAEGK